jgi:tetratricopeptide (TPR) repeat protein
VDQAFFATQAGKALGLPTLLFAGAGADSRHAWFGYFDERRGWNLDGGRGDEAAFVAGAAIDPQTWTNLTEHELRYLAGGFRTSDAYRAAGYHASIAAAWLARGDIEAATRAARAAVQLDYRLRAGWDRVIETSSHGPQSQARRIHALAEATRAFTQFPDLELAYALRLMEAWGEAGQHALVDAEQVRLLRKFERERPDLSARLARDIVEASFRSPAPGAAARAYERALEMLGRRAGIKLYDALVPWYVKRVSDDREAVLRAIVLARRHLRPPPGSQMDRELAALAEGR